MATTTPRPSLRGKRGTRHGVRQHHVNLGGVERGQDVTRLLHAVQEGNEEALDELMALVYDDLGRIAARHLRERTERMGPKATLEPAALVNECYLRLIDQQRGFANRGQFFAIASRLMLRVLLDHQRRREAARRGGGRAPITLNVDLCAAPATEEEGLDLELLTTALERLEQVDPRKAEVVRLRGLGGSSMPETAAQLEISLATAERDWAFARAWISRELARLRAELEE